MLSACQQLPMTLESLAISRHILIVGDGKGHNYGTCELETCSVVELDHLCLGHCACN